MISVYDPDLFKVQLATTVSAKLGEFVLGFSKLGVTSGSSWVDVPHASFNYTFDYVPDEYGTLIVGAETASISLSFKGEPDVLPLYPSDRVRVLYGTKVLFLGTVDSTDVSRTPVPIETGYDKRVDFVATMVGTYAAALTKEICYGDLPKESALKRITRWVKVLGWEEGTNNPTVQTYSDDVDEVQ